MTRSRCEWNVYIWWNNYLKHISLYTYIYINIVLVKVDWSIVHSWISIMNYEVYLALVQKKQPMFMFVESEFGHDCIIIPQKTIRWFVHIFLLDPKIWSDGVRKFIKDMEKMPQMYGVLGLLETNHVWICRLYLKCFFDRWPLHLFLMTRVHQAVLVVGQGKHTMVKKTQTQNFLTRKNTNTMQEKWQIFWHYSREKKNNPFQITLRVGSWIQKNTSLPPRAGYLGASKQLQKNKHIKMLSLDISWFISIWTVFSLKGETESIPCKENISALRKSKVSSGMTTSFTSAEFEGTSRQALGCPGKKETALVELSSISSSSLSSYLHHNDSLLIFIDFSWKQVLSTWSQHTTPTLTPAKNTHFRKTSAAKEKREKYHLGQCALSHDAQKFSR